MAYFPNGTAGAILDEQCGDCPVGIENPCPVAIVQSLYNYEQVNKGNEKLREAMSLLVNDDGICQMRQALLQGLRDRQQKQSDCCEECGNLFDLHSLGHVTLCSRCSAMLAEREG